MAEMGAAGLGLVVGWLLPAVRARGDRAVAASAGMVGIITSAAVFDLGQTAGGVLLASALTAAYLHAVWIDELRRRYGERRAQLGG